MHDLEAEGCSDLTAGLPRIVLPFHRHIHHRRQGGHELWPVRLIPWHIGPVITKHAVHGAKEGLSEGFVALVSYDLFHQRTDFTIALLQANPVSTQASTSVVRLTTR